jgi:hypothetical protein
VIDAFTPTCFKVIVEQLNVPVLVFADRPIVYKNQAADRLFTRLRAALRRRAIRDSTGSTRRVDAVPVVGASTVIALQTTGRGEPLHVHLVPCARRRSSSSYFKASATAISQRRSP